MSMSLKNFPGGECDSLGEVGEATTFLRASFRDPGSVDGLSS